MSDCPQCSHLQDAVRDAEVANAQQRLTIDGLNRSVAAYERRERDMKAKQASEQKKADEAGVVLECLKVWEQHCWAGKSKPKLEGKERPHRVRTALSWGFAASDIMDAFRGLGLLPYEGPYGARSATLKQGFTRKADVVVALRDETRIERFRDYYRRTKATKADRLLEQLYGQWRVERNLFEAYMSADRAVRWMTYRSHESTGRHADESAPNDYVLVRVRETLGALLGSRIPDATLDTVAQIVVKSTDRAVYEHYKARHDALVSPDLEARAEANEKGRLFLAVDNTEGKERAA